MGSLKKKIQLNSNDLIKLKDTALVMFRDKSAPLGYEDNNTAYVWLEAVVDLLDKKDIKIELNYRTKG
jgi:hypothetical protein